MELELVQRSCIATELGGGRNISNSGIVLHVDDVLLKFLDLLVTVMAVLS
eukprot:m.309940 g.309940  ORF g.309940 m.309940 type:complete len:50 (+) comp20206_c0_seq1:416-565(+)